MLAHSMLACAFPHPIDRNVKSACSARAVASQLARKRMLSLSHFLPSSTFFQLCPFMNPHKGGMGAMPP